ncbi:Uncharacterised protein [Klebsiella pneumoniae]|nr:Uncharacterised protein [Klebsiella pneumoniae]
MSAREAYRQYREAVTIAKAFLPEVVMSLVIMVNIS